MDGDFCRMCRRTVFDLTPMSDDERLAFLSGCTEKVCVSYTLPIRPAIAAAAMAAAMALPSAAAAQDADVPMDIEAVEISPDVEEMTIFVGGITNPAAAEMVEDPADAAVPELPVVYEEEPAQQPEAARPAKKPVSSPDAA
jgi:hypothetical protein